MARPPSTEVNETFLREVDENYRRDKIRDFFVENRLLLILAVLLFLVAAGATIWWREHRQAQAGKQVEEIAKIHRDLGEGKLDAAPGQLKPLAESSNDAVRATARFTEAAIALEKGQNKSAMDIYRSLASDDSLPQPYRDIALIRQTSMEFDSIKPDEVVARMKPLAVPGGPWFGTSAELTALALIKQGKKDEAARLFAAIARDETAPIQLRGRAVQIAASLGIDASDALPAQPAPAAVQPPVAQ